MEADGQKYSVLVKTEVREKMMEEIKQISEFFSVSKSDATVILVRLRWNSFKASDLLVDNKDKFLAELGLARVPISNSSAAGRATTTLPNGDGDNLVSTPFCSHKFSTACWSEYLTDVLVKNKEANTKRCPNCRSRVQRNEDPDYKIMDCICSYKFCWVCLRTAEEHHGNWKCVPVADPVGESSSRELTQIFRLKDWEARQQEMEKAKYNQRFVEENYIPKLVERGGVSELDIRTLKEAEILIVQCRQVLKWTCVFVYYMTEEYGSTKMQYLGHLRDLASIMVWNHEMTRRWVILTALEEGNFTCLKHKVETSTTNTGSHFDGFVKNLEKGMPEVLYGDGLIIRWECSKCFFKNKNVDKECQLCYFPRESPESSHVPAPDDLGKMD